MSESRLQGLWELVSAIPEGTCTSYGALGRALDQPTSGRMVGRWMAQCPEDIPWWRVVDRSGRLPIHKRSPHMAMDQRSRLEAEGVPFKGEAVDLNACGWEPR